MENDEIRSVAKEAMWESALSLSREYPQEFDEENQRRHTDDLLRRFSNKYLGDTVYRVGRDIQRKIREGMKGSLAPSSLTLGTILDRWLRQRFWLQRCSSVQPMMEGRCVQRIRSSCASGIQEALKKF